MSDVVRKDVLSVLKGVVKALNSKDFAALKDLSDHTIHNSSIFQDDLSIKTAVLVYALYKIVLRGAKDSMVMQITRKVESAISLLEKKKEDRFHKSIGEALKIVSGIDQKLKRFAEEVIRQAQIKKGSRLYEHGISLAQSAEVLGISQYELMEYVGKTKIADILDQPGSVESRIKLARKMFS